MYIINTETNRIEDIPEKSFSELGFKERENLQEWLANNPASLGEELLIIQKEFDGFNDTKERLDLLALDKQGNLVIIENKLDDTGKDVTWQLLKYASYCSSLNKQQIIQIFQKYLTKQGAERSAEEVISDFFDKEIEEVTLNKGLTQRLFLVAGSFRKEVTSTVLWLLNYNLRIQCYTVTLSQYKDQLFFNVEQIIPMKEAEEYSIRMAEKTMEDISDQEQEKTRHVIRRTFWTKLLKDMNAKSNLFQNISPGIYAWIGTGSGVRGFGYNFVISKKYVRVELYIDRGDLDENLALFDKLFAQKDQLEAKFGSPLEWERLENKRACRIKFEDKKFNVFEKEQWDDMSQFLTEAMINLESTFRDPIKKLGMELKN